MGEVSGLVDGRMGEASVQADWLADIAAEEEDTKEGERVVEEYAKDGALEGGVAEALTSG